MISKSIIIVGIIAAILFTMNVEHQSVKAAPITKDINKASDPGPGFGGEKLGTVSIDTSGNQTTISSNISVQPKQDKVFEAWLVDEGGSGYKLSLGQVDNGVVEFAQKMVNPYTYNEFIITEEPIADTDPNAAGTYAGFELPTPFGQ